MAYPNPFLNSIDAYVPGDQPSGGSSIKLNTNEFPYPAAPGVLTAIREAATDAIALYPPPRCDELRRRLAEFHRVSPAEIFVGNGSDEVLRLIIQAYGGPGRMTATVWPTYSLYRTLIQMAGSRAQEFPLEDLEKLPGALFNSAWDLLMLTVPNPPLGTLFPEARIAELAECGGLVALDAAYLDFAQGVSDVDLMRNHPNLIVVRTFSKSFGLAGLRVGYGVGRGEVIETLSRLADCYNVNRISQAAAIAALECASYYQEKVGLICADRDWLAAELRERGFNVPESHGNFLFAFHDRAESIYETLREKEIFVRHFGSGVLAGGIRISIGTRSQLEALLATMDAIA